MPAVTAIFLIIALILAVLFGPQTRAWTWGPAMMALSLAGAAALIDTFRTFKKPTDFGVIIFGLLVAGWFAWRASVSPVAELGMADLLLLVSTVITFLCIRTIAGHGPAEKIFLWGIAGLLLANVIVIGMQVSDASYSPIFRTRASTFPSGFYSHYNEAANYLIASSLLLGAAALFSGEAKWARWIWALIAIAGLLAVYFTRSRGGILGAAVGAGVFAMAGLMVAKRSGSRWFAPALIAIPVIGLGLAVFISVGWQSSQEVRNSPTGVSSVMDNSYRLYFLGIALSCVALHPLLGGGSRSFSWESYQFYDINQQGSAITRKAEQVHNELIQAATDYGLIGAGLLTLLLCTMAVMAVIRILFTDKPSGSSCGYCWYVGGLAGLAGMFVQSCFSFVFHLYPGVMLLGICLGFLSTRSSTLKKAVRGLLSKTATAVVLIGGICLLAPFGWKGSQVLAALWPTHFSKSLLTANEGKIDALSSAIRTWPHSAFYQERAILVQSETQFDSALSKESASQMAIQDYQNAIELHPYEPEYCINLANILSLAQRDPYAEALYQRAIQLQGGMEVAFQAHAQYSNHLIKKGIREFDKDDPLASLETLELAAKQLDDSTKSTLWGNFITLETKVLAYESLGISREASGDYRGAIAAYEQAAAVQPGFHVIYRLGYLLGKMGDIEWAARRPEQALGYFLEAHNRCQSTALLPAGVTTDERAGFIAHLEKSIAFLKGAKVAPIMPNLKQEF